MKKAIVNGIFFRGAERVEDHVLLIEHGRIAAITEAGDPGGDYQQINAHGGLVVPGFIDLQIYGAGSRLFSADPTAESLAIMDRELVRKGTTGFLACVATNTMEVMLKAIDAAKQYRSGAIGFMGLHLEGPFINPKRRGAHVEGFIHPATLEEVQRIVERADGMVKMMTLAPELQDDRVIRFLLDSGIVLSVGHSDAGLEEARAAYAMGFKTTTHLFNAMPQIHHRAPGLPVAAMMHESAMASIIADGLHVDFEMVKMAAKLMKNRLFLITDAVAPCLTGPYQHRLLGDKFVMPDGTLSGSNLSMLGAVKNCVEYCGVCLSEALEMASGIPAKLMGLSDSYGSVEPGRLANLLLLSPDLSLKSVLVEGVEY